MINGAARELRNDIRRDLVLDEGDAVAQLQLALLQPLQPQQIRRGRLMQGIDRRVEIAVLLLQPCELGFAISSLAASSASWRVAEFTSFSPHDPSREVRTKTTLES